MVVTATDAREPEQFYVSGRKQVKAVCTKCGDLVQHAAD